MDAPLAESPAYPEWRETEYQSFLRAISWSPSLSLIKRMGSGSACKWLSLRSFSLDIVGQLSVECSAGWYAEYARFGRLSLRKGEKEGEGLFWQKPVVLEPLTLVLSPSSRGEATERPSISQGRAGSEMTSVVLFEAEGLNHLLPFGGSLSFCLYPPKTDNQRMLVPVCSLRRLRKKLCKIAEHSSFKMPDATSHR